LCCGAIHDVMFRPLFVLLPKFRSTSLTAFPFAPSAISDAMIWRYARNPAHLLTLASGGISRAAASLIHSGTFLPAYRFALFSANLVRNGDGRHAACALWPANTKEGSVDYVSTQVGGTLWFRRKLRGNPDLPLDT
jgi:hypothetical protein